MRDQILNTVSSQVSQLMTSDVVNACNKYFIIDLEYLYGQCKERMLKKDNMSWMNKASFKQNAHMNISLSLCEDCINKKDFFQGFTILDVLSSNYNKYDEYWQSQYRSMYGQILIKWNINTGNDVDMEQKGINEYHKAVQLQPNDPVHRANLAGALEFLKKPALAVAQYLKAFEMAQENYNPYTCTDIARCYEKLKDNENANKYHLKALEKDPNNSELIWFYAKRSADICLVEGECVYTECICR